MPKLLMMRVDEVPFPKGGKKPVDVMAGRPVSLTCENITPPTDMGRPMYRFHVAGKTYERSMCKLDIPIPGDLGSTQTVGLDYSVRSPGGLTREIDHWESLVRPIPAGTYLRIRNVGTREGRPFANLMVPQEVIPYVEGALKVDGDPKNYLVLFFVQVLGADMPVLQVSGRPGSVSKFEVIAAPLTRYRRFGTGMDGYAAWPLEPIQAGGPKDQRKIFEIYAGIFEAKKVKAITDQLLRFEGVTEDGQPRVKVLPKRLEDIKALVWKGWLSEPLRVVRAAEPLPEPIGSTSAADLEL
ncbi:MAG: hypothetical protein PHU25_06120 [Deltaproteobacteria bacterium]|nr:hypothetical protein [Deltaproteobacteria bacterium]